MLLVPFVTGIQGVASLTVVVNVAVAVSVAVVIKRRQRGGREMEGIEGRRRRMLLLLPASIIIRVGTRRSRCRSRLERPGGSNSSICFSRCISNSGGSSDMVVTEIIRTTIGIGIGIVVQKIE